MMSGPPVVISRRILRKKDAAEKCVSIEFLFLEQESTHIEDLSETISNFVKHISDLENCSFRAHQPDAQVLCGLVIRWLQELKDDMDEPIQARFLFKSNIFGSENLLSCNLSASSNRVVDEFSSCQPFHQVISPSPSAMAGWMSTPNPSMSHAAPPGLMQDSSAAAFLKHPRAPPSATGIDYQRADSGHLMKCI